MIPAKQHKISDPEIACQILMDAIVTQKLAPSQKVSESILCNAFNISRAVCRNIIERLIAKHFLVSVSQRITQVAPLTLLEIKQNFTLRKLILPEVTSLAATKAILERLESLNREIESLYPIKDDATALKVLKLNKQLNLTIAENSGYPLMLDWLDQLEDTAMRIYWLYIKTEGSFPVSPNEQNDIFEALKSANQTKVHDASLSLLLDTEQKIFSAIFSHKQFNQQDLVI